MEERLKNSASKPEYRWVDGNWFNPETKEEREAKVYSRSMKESLDGLHAIQQRGAKQYGRNSNGNSTGNGQDNCTE